MEETWCDDIGRMFRGKHRRAVCHECCFDFQEGNEQNEADAGLRKPKTEVERVAEDREACIVSLELESLQRDMRMGTGTEMYEKGSLHI
jgi:hypothetical protein